MHILAAVKEYKMTKEDPNTYKQTGFLFIDFKQAFDSVDHEILINKIKKFKGTDKKWAQAVQWYLKQC